MSSVSQICRIMAYPSRHLRKIIPVSVKSDIAAVSWPARWAKSRWDSLTNECILQLFYDLLEHFVLSALCFGRY